MFSHSFINSALQLALLVLTFLSAITIHEFAHAWAAYILGDDTAKRFGRLTLNPLAHLDFFGFLFLIFFRIGWAKPVPMDARNFSHPRFFSVLAGLAGPFANFILALLCLYIAAYLPPTLFPHSFALIYKPFLQFMVWINVMLGVFNLIPLPPLDGSHIIYALLPEKLQPYYYLVARYSIFILLLLLLLPQTYLFLLNATLTMQEILKNLVF